MNWEKKLKEMNVLALGFFLFIEGKSVVFFVIYFLKRFSNFFYGVQSFLVFFFSCGHAQTHEVKLCLELVSTYV